MMSRLFRISALLVCLVRGVSTVSGASLPEASPAVLGFDPDRLAAIDAALDRAIADRQVPGAVVLVGRRGRIVYARASGRRAVEPADEAMTRDTAFALASLTKPLATATSIMVLIEQGKVRLEDTLARLWPECDNHGKGAITVEQLLRHRSGLIADNPIADYADGPDEAWKRIAELGLTNPPGEKFLYSDVNFLILGKLVEWVSGERLDRFASAHVFRPLGMDDTGFRPIGEERSWSIALERIAPTEKDDEGGAMLRGVVHDPRSRALGGVAGHAGLFGTADDLAVFAQMLLDGGTFGKRRVLDAETVKRFTTAQPVPKGKRTPGWDARTAYSSNRGEKFDGYGHTGFTGTSLW